VVAVPQIGAFTPQDFMEFEKNQIHPWVRR
jgi:hypothetical protein